MRNKLILVVAIVFGLLAAFLVYNYITNTKTAIENRTYTQVVTAAVDIPANTTIIDTMVELKPFPTELRTDKEFVDIKDVVGKVSSAALTKGEVILQNRIIKPGEGMAKLAYKVPTGMRAITIPIDDIKGMANLIKVGDRVDLIAVVKPQGGEDRATVIMQNIEVIALGSNLQETAAGDKSAPPTSLTLAVDPQNALRIKLAIDSTSYTFTMRPAGDKTYPATTPVPFSQL